MGAAGVDIGGLEESPVEEALEEPAADAAEAQPQA
jgi:hypothetical protein